MTEQRDMPAAQVLIVEDEVEHAEVMAEALRRLGHVCTIVHNLPEAQEELRHGSFDLVVTDLVMGKEDDGMQVLAAARKSQRNAEVILVTAHGDVPTAKAALRGGAYDFIEKPLDLDIFRTLCGHAIEQVLLHGENVQLREKVGEAEALGQIVGHSAAMRAVLNQVRQVAPSTIAVLITGESGTGKELVARAIHALSARAKKPFKPVNCAGLTESILESELFGHVKGAFTGAERDRVGVFEYADGGTLFLDEIGDMPLAMQAKLLRVLESGEVVRVGSNEPRHVNVRLISATNHDLAKLIEERRFREDLYFRIRGAEVHLAPLRERREDIPLLVKHFTQVFAQQSGRPVPQLAEDIQMALLKLDWPGNVRQLRNVVQNLMIVAEGPKIEMRHLPMELRQVGADAAEPAMNLEQIEKQAIRNVLHLTAGNREQAAKLLGVGERTLYRKLKEYGLK
jgi:two-component system response regulator HydG